VKGRHEKTHAFFWYIMIGVMEMMDASNQNGERINDEDE